MNIIETKNNTLIDMARKQASQRAAKNKHIFKDGVNQRASIKQKIVCDTIAKVTPCKTEILEPSLCKKIMKFENLDYIKDLKLTYYSKNNLFTRIFDFIAESTFPSASAFASDIRIGITYDGKIKMKGVSFIPGTHGQAAAELSKRLNDIPMISQRILNLESTDIKITYSCKTNNWSVGFASGKGSTIWSLFPPLVMLTPFTPQDAVHLLELFQLITHTIKGYEQEILL